VASQHQGPVLELLRHRRWGASGGLMAKCSRLLSLCIGCTILTSGPSWATTVESSQGDLSINHGQGFKPVKSRTNANPGDSVMVGPGGAATVVYDDGCKVTVQPGAVTTVAPLSPCASGSNAQNYPWECHPDQTHDCGWTAGTTAFWALWLGGVGVIAYEISRPTSQPSSP
jgi:hypothetical protein